MMFPISLMYIFGITKNIYTSAMKKIGSSSPPQLQEILIILEIDFCPNRREWT
jgi:hypothetical protein